MSRENQTSSIPIPKFANLRMGTEGYSVHITLNITGEIANLLSQRKLRSVETFYWKGRYYVRTAKVYSYNYPISIALYTDAYKSLDHLKVLIREAKISILKGEIATISADW